MAVLLSLANVVLTACAHQQTINGSAKIIATQYADVDIKDILNIGKFSQL